MLDTKQQLLYLYDLPKDRVTSVQVAKVIRERTGYDLQEPVQFRDNRPLPNGLPSDFQYGICKIDINNLPQVAQAVKYFLMDLGNAIDGRPVQWQCRALPFDRELLGVNKNGTNQALNVFVRNLDETTDAKRLDELFSATFGPVKSAKVSLSVKKDKGPAGLLPATSNKYGFVCFQNQEDAIKAVTAGSVNGIEIHKYQVRDARELRKSFNNIYVKNFNPEWTNENLLELFSKYGSIKSLVVMLKESKKDGEKRPFAFVCFDKEGDANHGREAADRAVNDLHDKEFNGYKLYVQQAIPADQRQAQVLRDQIRFKNSKKKCNLFVKNFPASYTKERLHQLFSECGEIESIKVIEGTAEDGRSQGVRAFVCYKQPDAAAQARARFHNQQLEGKNLYVTNYELPEVRKRQQMENKDKADFFTQKKNNTQPLEASLLNRPDTFHMIHQILQFLQKSMQGRFPQPGYNNNNGGNRGPHTQRQSRGPVGPGGRPNAGYPGGRPNYPQQAQPGMIAPAAQPTPTAVEIKGAQHLLHADPQVNAYNQRGFSMLPAIVPQNPNLKQFVGEFIYEYVEKFVGEELAPKITGMLIDLPIEEIKSFLYDFFKLQQKIFEARQILVNTAGMPPQ